MKKQCIDGHAGRLFVLVVFCLTANGMAQTSVSSSQEQLSAAAEEKEPLLALAMSALIPGLGQYYNGDIAKGVIQEIMVLGGFVFAMTEGIEEMNGGGGGGEHSFFPSRFAEVNDSFWLGLGVCTVGYLWSVIDAPLSAMNKNKQRSKKRYGQHLLEYGASAYSLGLDVKSTRSAVGLRLALHF